MRTKEPSGWRPRGGPGAERIRSASPTRSRLRAGPFSPEEQLGHIFCFCLRSNRQRDHVRFRLRRRIFGRRNDVALAIFSLSFLSRSHERLHLVEGRPGPTRRSLPSRRRRQAEGRRHASRAAGRAPSPSPRAREHRRNFLVHELLPSRSVRELDAPRSDVRQREDSVSGGGLAGAGTTRRRRRVDVVARSRSLLP